MSRDGRGNPGRIVLKDHKPRLRLADVLRRRKSTLAAFIAELGITTYPALEGWCKRLGIVAPDIEDFHKVIPPGPANNVSSPQEGVVVLEAPPVIDEITGRAIDPDAPAHPSVEVRIALVELPKEDTQKKARKKKGESSSEED